eukprot:NODE_33267_length_303_cov_6.937500.p1 GENE.NODE_33267_length_303_cov_6.937500~~NODE_33267_length_303_cov_6.937500.p1  ORF type:complete len:57 (+),score=5.07 NODE_33267_length_303_cov_6.937500:60-230(+)
MIFLFFFFSVFVCFEMCIAEFFFFFFFFFCSGQPFLFLSYTIILMAIILWAACKTR